MHHIIYLIIIFACIILSAFFSGSETALMRLRREHLEEDVKEAKGPAAVAVRDLLDHTSRLLVTILLGNNLVNIVGTAFASALAISLWGEETGVLIASIFMTIIILLFSEIFPKAVAARDPKRVSYLVGLPLYLIHRGLRPIHFLFDRVIEPIIKKVTGSPGEQYERTGELLALAREAGKEDTPSSGPIAIISGAARATEMTVSDIMISRADVVAFPVTTPANEVLDQILAERYTRVPIYEGSLDKVVGLLHLKDLAKLVRSGENNIRLILKPVIRVPERKPILQLLADMQRAFIHMAIVKDESGITQGIVTQEDILEEIVGEIRDEFDREELLTTKKLPDDSYEALGRLHVTDFNRQTGWEMNAERGDTLSGVVFNHLGRPPRSQDKVDLPGFTITVLDVSGTRVTRVRVEKKPEPDEAEEETTPTNM